MKSYYFSRKISLLLKSDEMIPPMVMHRKELLLLTKSAAKAKRSNPTQTQSDADPIQKATQNSLKATPKQPKATRNQMKVTEKQGQNNRHNVCPNTVPPLVFKQFASTRRNTRPIPPWQVTRAPLPIHIPGKVVEVSVLYSLINGRPVTNSYRGSYGAAVPLPKNLQWRRSLRMTSLAFPISSTITCSVSIAKRRAL